jgi:hypothetical protein
MDQVRQNTLGTVDGLAAKRTEYQLQAPPDALEVVP